MLFVREDSREGNSLFVRSVRVTRGKLTLRQKWLRIVVSHSFHRRIILIPLLIQGLIINHCCRLFGYQKSIVLDYSPSLPNVIPLFLSLLSFFHYCFGIHCHSFLSLSVLSTNPKPLFPFSPHFCPDAKHLARFIN